MSDYSPEEYKIIINKITFIAYSGRITKNKRSDTITRNFIFRGSDPFCKNSYTMMQLKTFIRDKKFDIKSPNIEQRIVKYRVLGKEVIGVHPYSLIKVKPVIFYNSSELDDIRNIKKLALEKDESNKLNFMNAVIFEFLTPSQSRLENKDLYMFTYKKIDILINLGLYTIMDVIDFDRYCQHIYSFIPLEVKNALKNYIEGNTREIMKASYILCSFSR